MTEFLVETKVQLEKLVSVTTDGATAMISQHTEFIIHRNGGRVPKLSALLLHH